MGHFRKLLASMMVLTIMATAFLGTSSIASAGDTATGSATLSPGSLAVNSVAAFDFPGTLNATQQTLNSSFIVNVADPTETSAGWHLQASITALSKSGPTVALGTNPKITGATPTGVNGTAPTNGTSYTTPIDLSTTAATIFSANATTGMGQSNINFNTSLIIPATTTSGSYTATLTVTIVAGP